MLDLHLHISLNKSICGVLARLLAPSAGNSSRWSTSKSDGPGLQWQGLVGETGSMYKLQFVPAVWLSPPFGKTCSIYRILGLARAPARNLFISSLYIAASYEDDFAIWFLPGFYEYWVLCKESLVMMPCHSNATGRPCSPRLLLAKVERNGENGRDRDEGRRYDGGKEGL